MPFGQPGPLQISTSNSNGADILTPPAPYMTLFIREIMVYMNFGVKTAQEMLNK